jgi:CDP-glycerol glycerophosphotransferase (TagB/SpsB family)
MKIDKRNMLHWLLLMQQGLYTMLAICARYLSPSPGKPVVILYGHQLSGNLKALYEDWQHSHTRNFEMYFLSLDPTYGPSLEKQGVQVLRCGRLRDMFKAGRCSAIITDHGLHAMQLFIRFTDIVFIDVWHGIPFKGFNPDDFRVQHQYDEVWVSSPLLKELYQDKFGFNPDIVYDMGYVRADKLFRNDAPDPTFRARAGIPATNKIVLYAPTWKQDDQGRELFPFNESQESFIRLLSETCLRHSATLVIRSHLNAQIGQQSFDNVVYCPMSDYPDSEDLLLHADALICDWSSIAFDYLALNRPTIFLDVEPPFKKGFSLGSEYRFGMVVSDMKSLSDSLSNALQAPDKYFAEQGTKHETVCEAVYGDNRDGHSAKKQLNHLLEKIVLD